MSQIPMQPMQQMQQPLMMPDMMPNIPNFEEEGGSGFLNFF